MKLPVNASVRTYIEVWDFLLLECRQNRLQTLSNDGLSRRTPNERLDQHFAALAGTRVAIKVDIETIHLDSFEASFSRTIMGSRGVLRFKDAEFPE